jgi:cation transport ATPase
MLAALHRRSTHPVARPFWRWIAEAQDIEVRDLCVEPGRGIAVQVKLHGDWMRVRLGHETFMQEPLPTWATSPEPQRRMFLELNGTLASVCLLKEELRASAVTACAQLSAAGYRTALLTGDATLPAEFAHAFDEARTSQRPAEKAGIISHWERSGLPVIFIGDGLNDAPALATATCSIAIGDSAALASASAQARWQQPEFAALPGLLEEARALDTRARLILRVALTYNTLGIIIAAVGLLHPAAAAVLMLLSSATVMALAARPLDGVFTPSSNPQKPPTLVKLQSSFA